MATALGRVFRRSHLGTEADRATFRTLHEASLAGPPLREGLTEASAERSIRHLRSLLGAPAVALTDTERVLAWDGLGAHHGDQVAALARGTESTKIAGHAELACHLVSCPVQQVILSPLVVDELLVGHLVVGTPYPTAGLVRATDEVASWVSGQLALAELDASRRRLVEAEVRALRAQISPHFIYNSLGAIASFVRTDPERARDLLLEFADFTRYSFRRHGEFTTLAEELRSIEQYLLLEQARYGERLRVVLRIAPEVLPVQIPFLSLQPLVENAVKHGLEGRAEGGTITVVASDLDRECEITIEDDGAGADPDEVRRALAGASESVGLANVDERLRHTFGDEYGLAVETAVGAGTRVILRVPKYAERTAHVTTEPVGLRVLVIDDERPALDELAFLLERDPRVHGVLTSDSATDALRVLQDLSVDAVFLDISMPGLSGLELAQVLARFKTPPPVVFVTAHEQHAVEAFELNAVDYVLKPVREERLAEAVRRVVEGTHPARAAEDDQVAVELGGVTRFISRADITYVEAQGDYARLHTADGSHLLRTPLATLEQEWQAAGFVRIHRSLLVSLPHVDEVRTEAGRCTVVVAGTELAVSRRHTRALRDLLVRRNRPGATSR